MTYRVESNVTIRAHPSSVSWVHPVYLSHQLRRAELVHEGRFAVGREIVQITCRQTESFKGGRESLEVGDPIQPQEFASRGSELVRPIVAKRAIARKVVAEAKHSAVLLSSVFPLRRDTDLPQQRTPSARG